MAGAVDYIAVHRALAQPGRVMRTDGGGSIDQPGHIVEQDGSTARSTSSSESLAKRFREAASIQGCVSLGRVSWSMILFVR